jgi:hypothetical protein
MWPMVVDVMVMVTMMVRRCHRRAGEQHRDGYYDNLTHSSV